MDAPVEDMESVPVTPLELFVDALKNNEPERAISYLVDPVFRQHVSLGDCLIETAKNGNFTTLDFILNIKARIHPCISFTDKMRRRALHHAATHGPLESVVRLIKAGSIVNCSDIDGYTPLLCACQGGRADIVEYLISEGAHINSSRTYKEGETALHIAAKNGNSKTVRTLLEGRADINATTKTIEKTGHHTALHKAAIACKSSAVETLCEWLAPLDAVDQVLKTPLHYTAEKGDVTSVEVLIRFGAQINVRDENGKTPLALAVKEGYPEIVQMLIFCGADVNMGDKRDLTPLHTSMAVKNYEVADLLIKASADINCQTLDTQESPLMVALSMGSPDLVQLLLSNGADVNLPDFKQYSPLHRSQTIGYTSSAKEELTELLLQAGAKLNSRDNQGHIALHRSIFTGSIRGRQCAPCIKQLVEAGSNLRPDIGAQTRNSPLYWLCSRGDLNIARYLVQCGWELKTEHWMLLPGKTPEQSHLHKLFQVLNRSVHSLKRLCRTVVRDNVSMAVNDREIISAINCLPLPVTVKSFLSLKNCEMADEDTLMLENH